MTYLVEIIRHDLLHLLGLEVSFNFLSFCLSACLSFLHTAHIFVSETNKFHYFDQYFNLLLRDADSGEEELLVNNITVVSISSLYEYFHHKKNIIFSYFFCQNLYLSPDLIFTLQFALGAGVVVMSGDLRYILMSYDNVVVRFNRRKEDNILFCPFKTIRNPLDEQTVWKLFAK